MIFVTGADLVLADKVLRGGTLVVDAGRIVETLAEVRKGGSRDQHIDMAGRLLVPGFIDPHVHGVAGHDVLDGPGAVSAVAERLPRWGVTAFSPTSIACPPAQLETFLADVAQARAHPNPASARVLPAHLESNFINPHFRGAQPLGCLRTPASSGESGQDAEQDSGQDPHAFSARDVLAVIDRHRSDISVVTLAPEIDGGLPLVRALRAGGIAVSLGHSGATFEEGEEAFAAGASRATHLFNRMTPMTHRNPGLPGAALANDDVAAELICDGHHVHPAMMRFAIGAKGPSRILAITDGTAGSGLPAGSRTRLGGQPVTVGDVARLDDGTMAGSVATMDRVLALLLTVARIELVHGVEMCAATAARAMGLAGQGVLAPGALADFVALDRQYQVIETWIGGRRVYSAGA
jgi:N-acetylglucosamine-6-phosphate deacetylase